MCRMYTKIYSGCFPSCYRPQFKQEWYCHERDIEFCENGGVPSEKVFDITLETQCPRCYLVTVNRELAEVNDNITNLGSPMPHEEAYLQSQLNQQRALLDLRNKVQSSADHLVETYMYERGESPHDMRNIARNNGTANMRSNRGGNRGGNSRGSGRGGGGGYADRMYTSEHYTNGYH